MVADAIKKNPANPGEFDVSRDRADFRLRGDEL